MSVGTERDSTALVRELQARLHEQIDESERLRQLARAVAAAPDTASLLRVLADSAAAHCHADAATVARIQDGVAEIVAATARVATCMGITFPIAGSLTDAAVRDQMLVSHPDYSTYAARVSVPDDVRVALGTFQTGPLLITPLIAHEEVLGVLTVMRNAGATPFTVQEERRLSVIADHVSVALKKFRLFEAAQAASQAKSTFLATVSHELRTPLTALTGYSELLADDILGPLTSLQRDTVERMRLVTHHLTVMIDEILTFSNIEAGQERIVITSVSPVHILRAAAAVLEPLAKKKTLDLVVAADEGVPPVSSDEDKLRQILVNLGGNAIKFTEKGSVRMSVTATGPEIHFVVVDTGIGITADDLTRLFQPFTQVDASLTRRYGGSGLGLYISQRLAALLGGRIEVQSVHGVGSTFRLVIPRDALA